MRYHLSKTYSAICRRAIEIMMSRHPAAKKWSHAHRLAQIISVNGMSWLQNNHCCSCGASRSIERVADAPSWRWVAVPSKPSLKIVLHQQANAKPSPCENKCKWVISSKNSVMLFASCLIGDNYCGCSSSTSWNSQNIKEAFTPLICTLKLSAAVDRVSRYASIIFNAFINASGNAGRSEVTGSEIYHGFETFKYEGIIYWNIHDMHYSYIMIDIPVEYK